MIAVRPFSIHPNRSTEVKVRMIIDNFNYIDKLDVLLS